MAVMHSIVVTRLDGLGDIVLGSGLLHGLHQRWPEAQITMVLRPQLAGAAAILPHWLELAVLSFDPRDPLDGREAHIAGALRGIAERCQADMCVLAEHNRVWAGEILASLSGAQTVVSFDGPPGLNIMHRRILELLGTEIDSGSWLRVPVGADLHEIEKYQAMFTALGGAELPLPRLSLSDEDRQRAQEVWGKLSLRPNRTVIFFPSSGDLLRKSLSARTWAGWLRHVAAQGGRSVLLLGSETDAAALDQVCAAGLPEETKRYVVPAGDVGQLAGLLDSARAYIGADTGPMHVAAVLGKPTLGVFGGGHGAQRFLPVGPRTLVVRMPLACYGCEWHCPFSERLCLSELPEEALVRAGDRLLAGIENSDATRPAVFDVPAPARIGRDVVGPLMRVHRRWLDLNHRVSEHHDVVRQFEQGLAGAQAALAAMTEANAGRDRAIAEVSATLAEMTRQNARRDDAIAQISRTLGAMTEHNQRRDQAIARLDRALGEMTAHNERRDQAIAKITDVLAEMTRHNQQRDRAIAELGERAQEGAAHATRVAELRRETEELARRIEDLGRRSLRIPAGLYVLLRRVLGRPRAS